jgi:hypothetical protein
MVARRRLNYLGQAELFAVTWALLDAVRASGGFGRLPEMPRAMYTLPFALSLVTRSGAFTKAATGDSSG